MKLELIEINPFTTPAGMDILDWVEMHQNINAEISQAG